MLPNQTCIEQRAHPRRIEGRGCTPPPLVTEVAADARRMLGRPAPPPPTADARRMLGAAEPSECRCIEPDGRMLRTSADSSTC